MSNPDHGTGPDCPFTKRDPRLYTNEVRDEVSRLVQERLAAHRRWDDEGFMVVRITDQTGLPISLILHDITGGGNGAHLTPDGTWTGPWDRPNPATVEEAEARLRSIFTRARHVAAYYRLQDREAEAALSQGHDPQEA